MSQTDLFAKYSPIMERAMVNISLVVDSAMLRLTDRKTRVQMRELMFIIFTKAGMFAQGDGRVTTGTEMKVFPTSRALKLK